MTTSWLIPGRAIGRAQERLPHSPRRRRSCRSVWCRLSAFWWWNRSPRWEWSSALLVASTRLVWRRGRIRRGFGFRGATARSDGAEPIGRSARSSGGNDAAGSDTPQHLAPFDFEVFDGESDRLPLGRQDSDVAGAHRGQPSGDDRDRAHRRQYRAETLSVRMLAECLRQFDITLDSIDVISQGARSRGHGQIAASLRSGTGAIAGDRHTFGVGDGAIGPDAVPRGSTPSRWRVGRYAEDRRDRRPDALPTGCPTRDSARS